MAFNDIVYILLEDNALLKSAKLKPIADAVKNRNPITFYYSGPRKPKKNSVKAGARYRAQGVAIGLNKNGNLVLRAHIDTPSVSKRGTPSQVGNEKANYGWRTFLISRMSSVVVMDQQTFDDADLPKYTKDTDDGSMSVTYVKSDWGTQPEVPEEPIPSVEPTTKVKKPTVKKQTQDIDKKIGQMQTDYNNVVNDLKSNLELIKQNQGTPEGQKYIEIGKELTSKKKQLEKQIDSLASEIGKNDVTPNIQVDKILKTVTTQKNQPTEPAPVPKQTKPTKLPTTKPKVTKPAKIEPIQKTEKPVNNTELPQPKPETKPSVNPEDDQEKTNLQETIKKIKHLMFS